MTMNVGGTTGDFAPETGPTSATGAGVTPRGRAPRMLKASPYPAVLGKGLLAAAKMFGSLTKMSIGDQKENG